MSITESQSEHPTMFDRSEIAAIAELDYSVVKSWSTGRPLQIGPSIRVGGKKGVQSLYSVDDLYRMAIAAKLSMSGFNLQKIEQLLELVSDNWFPLEKRGVVIFTGLETGKPKAKHLQGEPSERDLIAAALAEISSRQGVHTFPLKKLLDGIDKRITQMKEEDR